jgi:hypothetical protein
MAKQNKNVTIALDASGLKSLRRASCALSELAGAYNTMNSGAKRATR